MHFWLQYTTAPDAVWLNNLQNTRNKICQNIYLLKKIPGI